MTSTGTFVTCWQNTNFRDDQVVFTADNLDLSKPVAGTTLKPNDWAQSISTGPATWAVAYTGANKTGSALYIDPNTCLADLSGVGFSKVISCIVITDSRPEGWPGATGQTNLPGLWRGSAMSDLGMASVNKRLKKLCVSGAKAIPVAGTYISLLISSLWPAKSVEDDAQMVWAGMQKWVETLVADLAITLADESYQSAISGILAQLQDVQYDLDNNSRTAAASKYEELISSLTITYIPKIKYTSDAQAAQCLGYVTVLGTLILMVLRGGFLYAELTPAQADRDLNRQTTTRTIRTLRRTVQGGVSYARGKRQGQITIDHDTTLNDSWQLLDPYAQSFKGYSLSTTVTDSAEKHPSQAAAADQTFYADTYAMPTFDALFEPFLQMADLWTYMDQDPPADGTFAGGDPIPTVAKMGPYGGNDVTFKGGVNMHHMENLAVPFDHPSTGDRITKLVLHDVYGLEVTFGSAAPVMIGKCSGAASSLTFDLADSSRAIIGAFGAWDVPLKSLQLRTNYDTGNGGGMPRYDAGNHLGGDDGKGRNPFVGNGPDGGDAILSGVFGYTNDDGDDPMLALGFYWTYDRYPVRTGWSDGASTPAAQTEMA